MSNAKKMMQRKRRRERKNEMVSCGSIKVLNNISFICTVSYQIMMLTVLCTEIETMAKFTNNTFFETQRFIQKTTAKQEPTDIFSFAPIANSDCWVLQDNCRYGINDFSALVVDVC